MTNKNNKPVIFLAFANDRDDSLRYLRNLPDEARQLREVLEPAEKAGLCEVVVRSNCTAGDIFKVFQDPQYRNRIAVLHYGGHANGYQLLLESASGQAVAANAGGFAAFLAQQQGMRLVFLNGCSTREQTQGLLEANIPAVVSTSRSIDDKVATDFAFHFYQGLASGATIQTAFKEAEASVRTAKGDNTREAYAENPDGSKDQPETDRWPWDLHLSAGAESADQWNLPQAVDDPLFGLPPLPEQDLPESPYRYLDWFTRKDAEVFFGRGHQIRELYDRLTAPQSAPILLFYGQSGVGKSSILDAGLIPRLERDCEVRYLRRSSSGLLDTLQSVFGNQSAELSLDAAWREREEETGKPLIVFLDQVEEIFTRPTAGLPDEMDRFAQALKVIFADPARRPKGKLVLGFRKEWLAELETHLASHELPRSKVFLQPLDRRGVIEVVLGPTKSKRLQDQYGLTIEDDLPGIIADDLLEDRDSAIAPTLQILLTKLWTRAKEENYERPTFTQALYQTLKRDGILLRDFLDQQIDAFRENYPDVVNSGLLLDIVAMHTTGLGTANQCSFEQLQQQYAHLGAILPELLQRCQDLHLLTVAAGHMKDSSKTTRLAHDTLAPLIRERFEKSDKPGQRARRILDNRSVDWAGNKAGTPLDEADLAVVESGVDGTRALTPTEQRLLEASRKARAELKNAQRWSRIGMWLGVSLVLLAVGIAVYLGNKGQEAETEVKKKTAKAHWSQAVKLRDDDKNPIEAAYWFAKATSSPDEGLANAARLAATQAIRGSRLVEVSTHKSNVKGVVYDSSMNFLVWNENGEIIYTDASDGTKTDANCEENRLCHAGGVLGAVFIDNDSKVLSWGSDNHLRIWCVKNCGIRGEQLHEALVPTTLEEAEDEDEDPQFKELKDGVLNKEQNLFLYWTYSDDQLRFCKIDGNEQITLDCNESYHLPSHGSKVNGAAFIPGLPLRIISWEGDEKARVWSQKANEDWELQFVLDQQGLQGAVANKEGTLALTWGDSSSLWLWNISTDELGEVPSRPSGTPMQHRNTEGIKVAGAMFSNDGKLILSWTKIDPIALVWKFDDYKTFSEIQRFELPIKPGEEILGARFNKGGNQVLTWSSDNKLRLWDVATGDQVISPLYQAKIIDGAVFDPTETHILSWARDNTLREWEILTTSWICPTMDGEGESSPKKCYCPTMAEISAALKDQVSENNTKSKNRILKWSEEHDEVRLLDSTTKELLIAPMTHSQVIKGARFNPDETQILSWSRDGTVRLWEVSTGLQLVPPLYLYRSQTIENAVFFEHENKKFVLARYTNAAGVKVNRLWDLRYESEVDSDNLSRHIKERTGTELDDSGGLKVLNQADWTKVKESQIDLKNLCNSE